MVIPDSDFFRNDYLSCPGRKMSQILVETVQGQFLAAFFFMGPGQLLAVELV